MNEANLSNEFDATKAVTDNDNSLVIQLEQAARFNSKSANNSHLTSSQMSAHGAISGSRDDRFRRLLQERGVDVIDVYHGEMRFAMHPQVQSAILESTRLLLAGNASLLESDGRPLDKSQPLILRQLAADRLYVRWRKAGLALSAEDVLVCPYSSLAMIEAVLASVARPDGVILCPEGFYKSSREHIEKLGLSIRLFPVDLDRGGKIDPWHLRRAIQTHREQLCALLLTMPGNPLIATYSVKELQAIGTVVVEEGARVIIDATLDKVVSDYIPLASITVECAGKLHSLFDRIVTIAGVSKGHNAIGPYKIGAAITGDVQWRADIRRQLAVPFQRETTELARIVIEQTPDEYFEKNRLTMSRTQAQARQLCKNLEDTFGFPVVIPVGSSLDGPFLLIRLADVVIRKAGIEDGWQLAEFLFGAAGLETVAGPRMGLQGPIVRINVDAPRIGVEKDPGLLAEVFARLAALSQAVIDGDLTYEGLLRSIDAPSDVDLTRLHGGSSGNETKIIVLKEDRLGECRVALTPAASTELIAKGMRVFVESGAGSSAGYKDEAYIKAGATITAARSELFAGADIAAWVKPPADLDSVLSQLPPGCKIVGFTHPFHDDTVANRARTRNLHVQSLELLAQEGMLPAQDALAAMSRFGGRIALKEALALRRHLGHYGPQRVLIIGAGHAGKQSAQLAGVLGHHVSVASTGERHRWEVEQVLGAGYYNVDGTEENAGDLRQQQQVVSEVITCHQPEVIISTAKHGTKIAPRLIPVETLELLTRDTVIVDLNTTRGGNVAGGQVDRQLQTDNGVWLCNRSNYPSVEPAEASSAYAACLVSILTMPGPWADESIQTDTRPAVLAQ